MAGNVPDLKVEVAFGSSWTETAPSWTNVTSYVLDNPGLQIQRGKPNELSTFTSGRCTFTLNNNDGRFAPFNTGSPYYPNILPRTQVRVTATWASTDYVIFRGYIVGWPQSYSKGKKLATVNIEAYDAFALLNETVLRDTYYGYIKTGIGSLRRAVRTWTGSGLLDWVSGDVFERRGTVGTTSALAGGLTGSTAVTIGTTGGGCFTAADSGGGASLSYSISVWLRMDTHTNDAYIFSGLEPGGTYSSFGYVQYLTTGQFFYVNNLDGVNSSVPVNDGKVHHVVIVRNNTGPSIKCYVDGVDVSSGASVSGSSYAYITGIGDNTASWSGAVQELSVFDKALSATEIQNMYRLGQAFYAEDTATRLGRVLDSASWPSAWRDITTTPYGMAYDTWDDGTTALTQLQLTGATEQGAMFVSKDGKVVLKSRYTHQLDSVAKNIQVTFSDDGSDNPYVDVGYDYDDLNVVNSQTVTTSSVSATAVNTTSIARYGQQDNSIATQLGPFAHALTMAQGLVLWRKDPKLRARPLSLYPQVKTSTWPTILGLDLYQRVRFEITANGVGSQTQTELLLSQMDWYITQSAWELTVNGVDIPSSFFVLDTSSLGTDTIGF